MIEHLNSFVSNKLAVLKNFVTIFKLEAKLAQLSFIPLIINIVMLFVILSSTWLSLIVLAGYSLIFSGLNLFQTLILILCINLLALVGLLKYLSYNANNMSFKYTRAYFSSKEN